MSAHALRERVFRANVALAGTGLVIETFGNVSGADHDAGLMAIKPSGVPYQKLTTMDMVLVSIETGQVVDSTLRPSSDTPTHLELYRAFRCGGIGQSPQRPHGVTCTVVATVRGTAADAARGCRGPVDEANMGSIEDIFEQKEFNRDEIRRKLRTFAAPVLDRTENRG